MSAEHVPCHDHADSPTTSAAPPTFAAQTCCAPQRDVPLGPVVASEAGAPLSRQTAKGRHTIDQALVPARAFFMGDSQGDGIPADGELPVHPVTLRAFDIDVTTVTNADFQRFVEAACYRTDAELYGFSAVFHLAVEADRPDILGRPPRNPWWVTVRGADWSHPGGPRSSIEGREDHPAVHISWNDAAAYCTWAGRSLPTEAQWEAASRGGLRSVRYPWGNTLDAAWRTNIWQGRFPVENTLADGWLTTAPVRTYEPNGYGLWQTVGNVWEWCADWWSPSYYHDSPRHNPSGPSGGATRVMRGGSYLCHDTYCNRYRNAARTSNTPDSSMGNAGFRTTGL